MFVREPSLIEIVSGEPRVEILALEQSELVLVETR